MEQLIEQHPGAALYLRGHFNVNENNRNRNTILQHLFCEHSLSSVPILHKTYHHFTGGGLSDSNLDKILFSSCIETAEKVVDIICKETNPLINSHHDLIVLPALSHQHKQNNPHRTTSRLHGSRMREPRPFGLILVFCSINFMLPHNCSSSRISGYHLHRGLAFHYS